MKKNFSFISFFATKSSIYFTKRKEPKGFLLIAVVKVRPNFRRSIGALIAGVESVEGPHKANKCVFLKHTYF